MVFSGLRRDAWSVHSLVTEAEAFLANWLGQQISVVEWVVLPLVNKWLHLVTLPLDHLVHSLVEEVAGLVSSSRLVASRSVSGTHSAVV